MPATFHSDWAFGARVHIDEDLSFTAVVTGLIFRPGMQYPAVEVSWMHDGRPFTGVFDAWRLSDAVGPAPVYPATRSRRALSLV